MLTNARSAAWVWINLMLWSAPPSVVRTIIGEMCWRYRFLVIWSSTAKSSNEMFGNWPLTAARSNHTWPNTLLCLMGVDLSKIEPVKLQKSWPEYHESDSLSGISGIRPICGVNVMNERKSWSSARLWRTGRAWDEEDVRLLLLELDKSTGTIFLWCGRTLALNGSPGWPKGSFFLSSIPTNSIEPFSTLLSWITFFLKYARCLNP